MRGEEVDGDALGCVEGVEKDVAELLSAKSWIWDHFRVKEGEIRGERG